MGECWNCVCGVKMMSIVVGRDVSMCDGDCVGCLRECGRCEESVVMEDVSVRRGRYVDVDGWDVGDV